jgi:hypothetical protein
MTFLIRSSSHGNKICVFDEVVEGCITKTSVKMSGIKRLAREEVGISWYADRLGTNNANLLGYAYTSSIYARLDIRKFLGHKISYKKSFSQNYEYLERCISHYIDVWPRDALVPTHGDLTLDNVIFSSNGTVYFFDWEHFTDKLYPWGFDILYCLLSALLLPLNDDELPSKKDCEAYVELVFRLLDNGLCSGLSEYPLQYYRRIFLHDECWNDIVEASPHKLFPLKYEELYVDIVDDQITRRIRHKRYDLFKQKTLNEKRC